jgi:hypothetical protein
MLSCNSAASTLYTHVNQLPSMDSVSSVSSHSHDVTANCGVMVPPAAAAAAWSGSGSAPLPGVPEPPSASGAGFSTRNFMVTEPSTTCASW